MPTSAEFQAMKDATYWYLDSDDIGYYVYAPVSGDEGGLNEKKSDGETAVTGTYKKEDALLFFPAAGSGFDTGLNSAGYDGYYWSSSHLVSSTETAKYLVFGWEAAVLQNDFDRCFGFSIRHVS